MNLLEVKNLSVSFKVHGVIYPAVSQLSFTLEEGEVLGIVGESGCGKSLTALAIPRLLPHQALFEADRLNFAGKNLLVATDEDLRKIRGEEISFIFQEPMTSLNPLIKIGKQIAETVTLHENGSKSEAKRRTLEIMQEVGLPDVGELYNRYPHELSGGMRQRVMIATAMILHPRLLIADEPTTALDVTIQAQILHLMRQLNRKHQNSIIFISHDLGVIKQLCNRVMVMYMGMIVEQAQVSDLLNHPLHPYTQGLIAALPNPRHRKAQLYSIGGKVLAITERPVGCAFAERCQYAQPQCYEQQPLLRELEESHLVRCFYADQIALGREQ